MRIAWLIAGKLSCDGALTILFPLSPFKVLVLKERESGYQYLGVSVQIGSRSAFEVIKPKFFFDACKSHVP